MSKGQMISMDFMVGILIFLILFTFIFVSSYVYPIRLNQEQSKNEMLITVFQVSDAMVKTPGSPSSWEKDISSLKIIGLADSDRILSASKVSSFVNLSYNNAKDYFGYYDFHFSILNLTYGEIIGSGLEFNGTNSMNIRRMVIYNGERATMELRLWK